MLKITRFRLDTTRFNKIISNNFYSLLEKNCVLKKRNEKTINVNKKIIENFVNF
jgi:hypothetical protein